MTTNQGPTLRRLMREQAMDALETAEYDVYEEVGRLYTKGWPDGRVPPPGRGELHISFGDGTVIVCRKRRRRPPQPPTVVEADKAGP